MIFDNNDIHVLDPNIDLEDLREYAEERNFPFYMEEPASHWNAYAHKYGSENGLTFSERLSFAYMCSSIFGGLGYSCSTEAYFKEEKITHDSIDALNQLREDETLSEEQIMRDLFDWIFTLYNTRIDEYTFKTEKIGFRISLPMMEHFEEVDGETRVEKFQNLLLHWRFRKYLDDED